MAHHAEHVAQIAAITGADVTQAEHLLDASGGNMDAAVQLFFETGAAERNAEQDSQALARQMMQEDMRRPPLAAAAREKIVGADVAGVADAAGASEEDGDTVRSPDATRTERLFDAPGMPGMLQMPPRAQRPSEPAASDLGIDLTGAQPGLDAIYKPPAHILSDVTLEECAAVQL